MEFEYNDSQYRLERGKQTGAWLLLENRGDRLGWHLLTDFDPAIYDEDILDRAKVFLGGASQ